MIRDGLTATPARLSVIAAAVTTVLLSCGSPTDASHPPVATVTVSPPSMSITVGSSTPLQATPEDAQGTVLHDREVFWTSSDTTVSTVSGAGVVTALRLGTARIVASAEGEFGSATITVTPPVDRVEMRPRGFMIVGKNRTAQLTAITYDAQGNVLTGRPIAWETSDPAVATVDTTGLVTGVGVGGATITATAEGKSATARILVSGLVIGLLTVTP